MIFPVIVSLVIIGLIVVIPILGNLKTPENLFNWCVSNAFKVSLIAGTIAVALVWLAWFLC